MVATPQEQAPMRMTEAEYLEFEQNSDLKHEFVDGKVYAMTGGSVRQNVICLNVGTTLNVQLADKDCIVSSPDTRVKVRSRISYRYPDVTVICGQVEYAENRVDTITNPIVLIEVLSPGTAVVDHNQKLDEYIQINSLQEYVIISQNDAKIERYLRQESGDWLYTQMTGLDAVLDLPSIGCKLALADVYRKLSLTDIVDDTG
jgi:Uma2 family endonuclease